MVYSQGIQQNNDDFYLRILQISGISNDISTYHIRPYTDFSQVDSLYSGHPLQGFYHLVNRTPAYELPAGIKITPYEPVWFQSYNTSLPRGGQDGAIWQGKGYNTAFSTGLNIQFGPLYIDFRPVIGMAQNLSYDLGPHNLPLTRRREGFDFSEFAYKGYYGSIDYVQRYGESAYSWADWGDSSVELRLKGVKVAYSNKRIWSGPGVNTSLQFGYNAPGFRHFYFGTYRPLQTRAGTLEFAYIFGKTIESDYYSIGRQIDSHSVNSLLVAWQPWFTERFSIGGIRTYYFPYPDSFSEYRSQAKRLFESGLRNSLTNDDGELRGHDPDNQVANLFVRYMIPEHGFEFYVEYGRNDHNADWRDFRAQPGHHRGYTLGLIKTSELSRNRLLAISAEYSELAATRTALTRGNKHLGGWYTHSNQKLGLTNNGQLFGNAFGPGANTQMIRAHMYKEKNSWELSLARVGHHNSLLDQYFEEIFLPANNNDVERWEARNIELMAGFQMAFHLPRNIELGASLYQSYIFNQHYIKKNDMMNTRFEVVLRKNIEGWLR